MVVKEMFYFLLEKELLHANDEKWFIPRYEELISEGFLSKKVFREYIEMYERLPRPMRKKEYELISRRDMGRFAALQECILETRIEIGDEQAEKEYSNFKYKKSLMFSSQGLTNLGFL